MICPDNSRSVNAQRGRRRWVQSVGVGALAMLAVIASACGSSTDSRATATTKAGGGSSALTMDTSGSSSPSSEATIDPCSVLTSPITTKVYGADATVLKAVPDSAHTCSVQVKGLNYDLNVSVFRASDYNLQKSMAFENPKAFPGLGKEAVIGKSSDNTGAAPGLLYRTDRGAVYIGNESDPVKLTALGKAIAAQG